MYLAKVVKQPPAQTVDGFAVPRHRLQALIVALAHERGILLRELVGPAVFDEKARGFHVSGREEQDAVGILAVASSAARLLIVGLETFRHVVMDDKADV